MFTKSMFSCMARTAASAALVALLAGCRSDKASHQNGIVVYVSTSGQLGVGFGECEDLPAGCRFYRAKDVYTVTEANWLFGATTNHTRTVTAWDTTCMATNDAETATAKE